MRTGKNHLFRLVVVTGAALAAAVPTAQAAGPDNRALYRGSSAALAPTRSTPDDRSFYRGTSATLAPAIVTPDDRAYNRATSAPLGPKSLSPDDRAFARSARSIEPRTIPTAVAVSPSRFDWGDALIGGTFGLAFALLGGGAVLIALRHRRGVLRTA